MCQLKLINCRRQRGGSIQKYAVQNQMIGLAMEDYNEIAGKIGAEQTEVNDVQKIKLKILIYWR